MITRRVIAPPRIGILEGMCLYVLMFPDSVSVAAVLCSWRGDTNSVITRKLDYYRRP